MILQHETLNIQEGDILLIHTKKGFLPKGIRWATKCHYNHAALVVKAMGELYILEAVENGFILTKSLEKFLKEIPEKREIMGRRPKTQNFTSFRDSYLRIGFIIGNKYDYKSLLWSQLIWQFTKKWRGKRDIKASKRIYCSEACAYAYYYLFPEWWLIAPVDLVNSDKLRTVLKLK